MLDICLNTHYSEGLLHDRQMLIQIFDTQSLCTADLALLDLAVFLHEHPSQDESHTYCKQHGAGINAHGSDVSWGVRRGIQIADID